MGSGINQGGGKAQKGLEMNREETKQAIEVMQAWLDGKEIEFYSPDHGWQRCFDITGWKFDKYEYRVKPAPRKPREWLLDESPSGWLSMPWDRSGQEIAKGIYFGEGVMQLEPGHKIIKVREVIE